MAVSRENSNSVGYERVDESIKSYVKEASSLAIKLSAILEKFGYVGKGQVQIPGEGKFTSLLAESESTHIEKTL